MAIISIQSPKGGTAKSTLAFNLYHYLKLQGKKVLFIDTDSQLSSMNLLGKDEAKFACTNEQTLKKVLLENAKNFSHIIIDTSPTITHFNKIISNISDSILLTLAPTLLDNNSIKNYVLSLENENKQKLKILFTKVKNNKNVKQNRELIASIFAKADFNILNSDMSDLLGYQYATNDKTHVFNSKYKKQKIELENIFEQFLK